MLDFYQRKLKQLSDHSFLEGFLKDPLLKRLRSVGYFCGMDYASKDIYNFSEYISRYDHSLNVALLTYYLTKDKTMSLAGLYHDIATPCFSHVIDYMNKDYLRQESTEEYTKDILEKDNYLYSKLKESSISLEDVINFKQYSVVDNERPKLCADRLDAVVLNSIGWIKNITKEDINNIVDDIYLETNEESEREIAFKTLSVGERVKKLNNDINIAMHSLDDIFMMQLLADIVKEAISIGALNYEDLYTKTEVEIFNKLSVVDNKSIRERLSLFYNIRKPDIKDSNIQVKDRSLSPLVRKKRI